MQLFFCKTLQSNLLITSGDRKVFEITQKELKPFLNCKKNIELAGLILQPQLEVKVNTEHRTPQFRYQRGKYFFN